MTIQPLKAVPGTWTDHGKRQIAIAMIHRGEQFLGAGLLLKQQGGNGYVWRHLLCQAGELVMKGCLLLRDYNHYRPLLKRYGHRLLVLSDECIKAYSLRPLSSPVRVELANVSSLYESHDLRYASGLDILVHPDTIQVEQILRRLFAATLIVRRAIR